MLIILSLLLIVSILYWPVMNFEFICFDDGPYVSQNPHVLAGISRNGIQWAFTTFHEANWHPLTWLSLMLDGQLYGLYAGGYHWTNVMFHLANTLLLFLVLNRMTGELWCSGFVAALFAIHPLHVESVAWVAERKDVLSAFFWMLTMGAYVRYAEDPSLVRYLPVLLFFVFGLMSKPMLVTLPFVLLLLDYWPLERFRAVSYQGCSDASPDVHYSGLSGSGGLVRYGWKWLLMEKAPLLFLSLLSCIVTWYAQLQYNVIATLKNLPLHVRIENALLSYFVYIRKTVWPVDLAIFYPHSVVLPFDNWQIFLLVASLSSVTIISIRMATRHPYLPVGWLWYLGTLVPVIGLVQVGEQAAADRYTYIPLIGLFIMLVWGWTRLCRPVHYRFSLSLLLSILVIFPLIILTSKQIGYWQNGVILFTHALKVTQGNYVAENNLGLSLMELGRNEDAVGHFESATRIQPDFATAYHNLGVALHAVGRHQQAVEAYKKEINLNPTNSEAYYRMGLALSSQKRYLEAVPAFRKSLSISPDSPAGYSEMGTALTEIGQYDEAKTAYIKALRLQSDHPGIHNNYAMLLFRMGDSPGAVRHFMEAIRLQPDYANAHYQLSHILRDMGDNAGADRHLREAVRINPAYRSFDRTGLNRQRGNG